MNSMKRIAEILLLAGFWFVAMAWIEWDYNPKGWSWVTRLGYVLILLLVMILAMYPGRPGGGTQGVGKSSN